MARLQRFKPKSSTRAMAGLLSVSLHLGVLVLIAVSGGRWDGLRDVAAPAMRLVRVDTRATDRRDGIERDVRTPAMPKLMLGEPLDLHRIEPTSIQLPELDIPDVEVEGIPLVDADIKEAADAALVATIDAPSTFIMPQVQASELLKRVERLAEELAKTPSARVSWQQDGRHYDAELVLEPARNGIEPERAIAEISAEHQGRQLRTRISLKRLPFSHFAQVIDQWDPMVQLHDDEIGGRMHINSRFNVLYDAQAAPRLLGKVTTAAGGFNMERRGRRPDSDVFRDGIETSARRIPFSEQGWSFEGAQQDAGALVHGLAGDTDIRFLADGGYRWRDRKSSSWQYAARPVGHAVHFMASPGATVYVKGVVSGQFLVYSPDRIVVEGNITYARDPRSVPDSDDFLGLVCDRNIEVAPTLVTGRGDLQIQAAMFAKRRFAVRNASHPRSATLYIFGSLAAGTMSESEPRYATKLEHDWRFERLRPPGFPSMNRFVTEDWDRQWTDVPEGSVSAEF